MSAVVIVALECLESRPMIYYMQFYDKMFSVDVTVINFSADEYGSVRRHTG